MFLAMQTFQVTAPSNQLVMVGAIVLLVFVAVFALIARIVLGMRAASFQVEGGSLHIKAPLYGRTVAKSALKLEEARVVTLRDVPDLQPTLRMNGAAMGGLRVGRFKLKNGETAMVYVTGSGTTLWIPTTEGYTLLLETPQASELLAALKSG